MKRKGMWKIYRDGKYIQAIGPFTQLDALRKAREVMNGLDLKEPAKHITINMI